MSTSLPGAPAALPSGRALAASPRAAGLRLPWRRLVPIVLFGALLMLWEGAVAARLLSPLLFTPPGEIARTILALVGDGTLLVNGVATLGRVFAGLALGGAFGVGLGLLMGWSRAVRTSVDPWVAAAHAIPKIAVFPLFIFLMGIDEEPKLAVAALVAFFPMLISAMAGVGQIHPVHLEVAQNYGAHLRHIITRVVLPGSLPVLLSGVRLAFNGALLATIAVEMVGARSGLGVIIWSAWETLQTENLWASLVVIAVTGITFNFLLEALTRRLVPWQMRREI
jgi:NitT/TauT family transport system permease protein